MLKPNYIPVLMAVVLFMSTAVLRAQFILEAPSGTDETNYRWYEASDPATVLGTDSWYEVYTPGVYFATYDGTLCGHNATSYFIVTYCRTPDNEITLDISQSVPNGATVNWSPSVSGDQLRPTVIAPAGEGNIVKYTATVSRQGNNKVLPSFYTICLYGPFILVDDFVETEENLRVTIDMLANDSDIPSIGVIGTGTPSNGTVVVDMNGTPNDPSDDTLIYTPDPGFTGTDSFTYELSLINSDGSVLTQQAVVTVNVLPGTGAVDDVVQVDSYVPQPEVIRVLDNDNFENASSVTVIAVSDPAHGTVTINADGTVTYLVDNGYVGPDSFTYTVAVIRGDGSAYTDTATVQINAFSSEPPIDPSIDEIAVHQLVTPNGDGLNDFMEIIGIERYPDNTVKIYNRWGVLVFETRGYNNRNKVFAGISEGRLTLQQSSKLPSGTYYYVIEYGVNGIMKNKAGYFYINNQ